MAERNGGLQVVVAAPVDDVGRAVEQQVGIETARRVGFVVAGIVHHSGPQFDVAASAAFVVVYDSVAAVKVVERRFSRIFSTRVRPVA